MTRERAQPADALSEAELLLSTRQLPAAKEAFDTAERGGADPDRCSGGRWMIDMLRGDLEAAWQESDAVRRRGAPHQNRFWLGEDLTGKRVMLRCLHGFGDTVQNLRYAALIAERAASLVVEVPPGFTELAPMFRGIDEVITWGTRAPEEPPDWDVQVEVNELPYVFRTQPQDLPVATGYLRLPRWLSRPPLAMPNDAANLRIGVVWASGDWNPSRSVSLELLRPLLNTPGCEFWNLQGGASRAGWHSLPASGHLHAADECADSLTQLAALIGQLDLIITPDTLAAHLAGALGTPAWVMLEHAADWRWQQERTDSPWYPSLRLFRQKRPYDWAGVVQQLDFALAALLSESAQTPLIA